jgi:hypothetical protein
MTECFAKDCVRPGGTSQSHCARCHRTFTGPSAFDKHQTLPEGGTLECHHPETRGLVTYIRHGLQVWGWPQRGDTSWYRHHGAQTA